MIFLYPWMLGLGLLLVPMIWRRYKGIQALKCTAGERLKNRIAGQGWLWWQLMFWLQVVIIGLLILASARPQLGRSKMIRHSEGLDIVLVIDTSHSMKALDLKLNDTRYDRLTVVKNVVRSFIQKRLDDRIGMVVFGTEAYTQAPLTHDHDVLLRFLGDLEIGMAGPATAIGDALSTAVKRLKDLEAKSKVVILLTDGANTAGNVAPRLAAQAAATLGIKLYTIGIGSNGMVPVPDRGFFGQKTTRNVRFKIDKQLLKDMAAATGGKAFFVKTSQGLQGVYDSIDLLEKTKVELEEFRDYKEASYWFLWPALGLLLLHVALSMTRLRSIP